MITLANNNTDSDILTREKESIPIAIQTPASFKTQRQWVSYRETSEYGTEALAVTLEMSPLWIIIVPIVKIVKKSKVKWCTGEHLVNICDSTAALVKVIQGRSQGKMNSSQMAQDGRHLALSLRGTSCVAVKPQRCLSLHFPLSTP